MSKLFALVQSPTLGGNTAIRLLIVSYFVALALGLIEGTDLSVLVAPFLSETIVKICSGLGVIGLSAMILFGFQRRVAALLLAIILFWCSFLAFVNPAGTEDIGGFWRDLALIGALLLTYADAGQDTPDHTYDALPDGGAIPAQSYSAPEATLVEKNDAGHRTSPPSYLFREDFDIIRAT